MIRYFVTGAGGFIGRHLCRLLIEEGRAVTALARNPPAEGLLPPEVRVLTAALDQPQIYGPALAECEVVVHLAGLARFGNGPQYRRANVEDTGALLEAVKERAPGLRRFLFVSTMGAVDRRRGDDCRRPLAEDSPPNPTTDYGRSKLEAERLVEASGLPFCIVRPAMIVGADMRANSHVAVFARMAAAGSLFAGARWPGRVSVLHVRDLARALFLASEHPGAAGRTFFAGGGAVSIGEILDLAAPGRRRLGLGWLATGLRPLSRLLPFQAKVLLHSALVVDDGPLRELGWSPRVGAAQAAAEVAERERRRLDPAAAVAGRTVVTGAASGLGRALAETLAPLRRGLILIDRDRAGLDGVCPGREGVERVGLDLGNEAEVGAFLKSGVWTREPIDEFFACAGIGRRGRADTLPYEAQAAVFKVNVLSRIQMIRSVLGSMIARQFGRIVLISSSSAFQALPFMSAYAASNSALLLFGEGLAAETEEAGLEVLTVCPGGMRTAFQKSAGVREVPGERLAEPEEVAREILGALGRNRIVLMPSLRSKAMAAAARILPRRVSLALWGRLMERLR